MARTRNLDPGREWTLRYASVGMSRHGKPLVYACLLFLVGAASKASGQPAAAGPCVSCQVLSVSPGQVSVLPDRLNGTRVLVRSDRPDQTVAAVAEIRRLGGRSGVHFTAIPAEDDVRLA